MATTHQNPLVPLKIETTLSGAYPPEYDSWRTRPSFITSKERPRCATEYFCAAAHVATEISAYEGVRTNQLATNNPKGQITLMKSEPLLFLMGKAREERDQ